MDKRAIILFTRKNKLLLGFLSAIIIQLPQYIDSIWSLSERISGGEAMSIYWLYWITIPLGLGMLALIIWLTRKPVLNEDEKSKVVGLMEAVNVLDDRMERFYWKSLRCEGDRVVEYERMLASRTFKTQWNKYSSLRASVSIVSPKLSEQARMLITLLQHFYGYALKEWYESELSTYKKAIEESISATEIIRKSMNRTFEKLIG